jgi:peptidoglycan/LPS O-acetylase OafA/YrhL
VQQTLAHLGLIDTPVLYVALGLVLTLALASLSWVCIERPALRRRRGPRPVEAPEAAVDPRAAPQPAGAAAG